PGCALSAGMESRGRMSALRELLLNRLRASDEAEHARRVCSLCPPGEREQSFMALAEAAQPDLTAPSEYAGDDSERLAPDRRGQAQIEDDWRRARQLRDGASEDAGGELIERPL